MLSKITILVVLCSVAVFANPDPEKMKEEAMDAMEKCKGESTPEAIEKAFQDKSFPDSMNCYVGCMCMELKWLTPEGKFNQAHADEAMGNCPEDKKAEVQKAMDKMKEALGDISGKCEAGAVMIPLANDFIKQHMSKME